MKVKIHSKISLEYVALPWSKSEMLLLIKHSDEFEKDVFFQASDRQLCKLVYLPYCNVKNPHRSEVSKSALPMTF